MAVQLKSDPSLKTKMNVIGFAILRNGVMYDYPFRESLRSLSNLCSETFLALGKGTDPTEIEIAKLSDLHLKIIPTVWDESRREGGRVLSDQTNISLEEIRKKYSTGWAFYLQSDEVLCEWEAQQILNDLKTAESLGCDAVSFRYLHFWQTTDRIAIDKKWYPEEVRAIRIDSSIRSSGDAQGFSGVNRVYQSDAHVFHYGHVRERSAYERKKKDFHRWWHPDSEIEAIVEKAKKRDQRERTLPYFGPHPAVMADRLQNTSSEGEEHEKGEILVYGSPDQVPESIRAQIPQNGIRWTNRWADLLRQVPTRCVLLRDLSLMQRLRTRFRYGSAVPHQMLSDRARPWEPTIHVILKFSERGISLAGRPNRVE